MPTFRKTSLMRQIELRYGGKPIEQIVAQTIRSAGSLQAAAEQLGVAISTLRQEWMPAMGITRRVEVVVGSGTEPVTVGSATEPQA